jgi:hypothetical protein
MIIRYPVFAHPQLADAWRVSAAVSLVCAPMRTRVVSIITSPLRFLRWLLGLLLRSLRAVFKKLAALLGTSSKKVAALLGKPLERLPTPSGTPRIVVFAVLGLAVVLVAILVLRPGPDADKQVRETLDRYAKASRDKDYQTLCDDLLASQLVDKIRSAGLPCEVALRTGLNDRRNPQLTVLGIEVDGDQALARARTSAVGEPTSEDTIRLVHQDANWRVASLQQPGSDSQLPGTGP